MTTAYCKYVHTASGCFECSRVAKSRWKSKREEKQNGKRTKKYRTGDGYSFAPSEPLGDTHTGPISMTDAIQSFPPIAGADARILVLGSMPGEASLRAGEYYAHRRNLFWCIVSDVLGFDPEAPYSERAASLIAHGVALWDVAAACVRPGSLDSSIVSGSVVANDIAGFLASHARIGRICFNGVAAETLFRRHVDPILSVSPSL